MALVTLTLRIALAIVFAFSGITKLFDISGSRRGLVDFGFPPSLARPVSVGLPVLELAIASWLVLPATAWWGSFCAVTLLAIFTGAVAYQLLHDRTPECHCFGQLSRGPIGPRTLARNGILTTLALFASIGSLREARSFFHVWMGRATPVDATLIILGVLLVFIGVGHAWLLVVAYQRLYYRMDLLNTKLQHNLSNQMSPGQVQAAQRKIPSPPSIGDPLPLLELSDTNGTLVDLAAFSGRETVLVFTRPTCAACHRLLPELLLRDMQPPLDAPAMVIISRGSIEENLDYVGWHSPVLLAQDAAAAYAFGISGSPSAVKIAADGTMASEVVLGGPAVKDLLEITTSPATSIHADSSDHRRGLISFPRSLQRILRRQQVADI